MRIVELFYSLQGEGLLTGVPSLFIRTAGCNLDCRWCDTRYARDPAAGTDLTPDAILARLRSWPQARHCVVTGGGGKSKVWTQMIANLLDKELIVTPAVDACTGAAMMGAIGIGLDQDTLIDGLWKNYEIERIVADKDRDENLKMYKQYTKVHNLLEQLYREIL